MLKRRLIPVLFLKDGFLVRSQQFNEYKILGDPVTQVKRYNDWNVDELIYLNISTDRKLRENQRAFLEVIRSVASKVFMPLTVGGGIDSLDFATELFAAGADKLCVTSQGIVDINFLTELAKKFGSQAVVAGVDYKKSTNGEEEACLLNTKEIIERKPLLDWVSCIEGAGAGEIFMNSIDKDGTGSGFNIDATNNVCDRTSLPVITCGGAASVDDFYITFEQSKASAIAAGNIFNFKELAYPIAKKELKRRDVNVR